MLPFTLRAVDGRLVRNPSVATACKPSLYHHDRHCRAVLKRSVPLSRYRIRSLKPLYPFDISAAERWLSWRPRVGTREGLQRTFR